MPNIVKTKLEFTQKWAFAQVHPQKLEQFLQELSGHGQIKTAAKAVGINANTIVRYISEGSELLDSAERQKHYEQSPLNAATITESEFIDALKNPDNKLITPTEREELTKMWIAHEVAWTQGILLSRLAKQAHGVAMDPYILDKEVNSSIAKQREIRFKASQKLLERIAPDEYGKESDEGPVPGHIFIENYISGKLVIENKHLAGPSPLANSQEINADPEAGTILDVTNAPIVDLAEDESTV